MVSKVDLLTIFISTGKTDRMKGLGCNHQDRKGLLPTIKKGMAWLQPPRKGGLVYNHEEGKGSYNIL